MSSPGSWWNNNGDGELASQVLVCYSLIPTLLKAMKERASHWKH